MQYYHHDALLMSLCLVKKVEAIAARKGCTPSQLALAWVMSHENVIALVGTKRRNYLEENAASVQIGLTQAELQELESVMPRGITSGARYPEHSMRFVQS